MWRSSVPQRKNRPQDDNWNARKHRTTDSTMTKDKKDDSSPSKTLLREL